MTKIITLYNHKGGVSKTTTIFNLAHLLAESGCKTLVVDADPQCNITEFLLASTLTKIDEVEEETDIEQQLPGTSILDLLKPRVDGDRADVDVSDVVTVEIKENLYLLRGDVALSEIEEALAEFHIQRLSNKTHEKKTYVALGAFLREYGTKEGFDFILLDVGPSSGALTRACFLVCDGYFIPTMPDRFNVQALGTLSKIISRWMEEHSQIYDSFKGLGLPVALGRPQCLGIILQNFKLLRNSPRKGYKRWISRIPIAFEASILPVLRKFSHVDRDLSSGLSKDNCIVVMIPDFQSLGPLSQETGTPVFALTAEETKAINNGQPYTGVVWADIVRRMENFKAEYEKIKERMESIK